MILARTPRRRTGRAVLLAIAPLLVTALGLGVAGCASEGAAERPADRPSGPDLLKRMGWAPGGERLGLTWYQLEAEYEATLRRLTGDELAAKTILEHELQKAQAPRTADQPPVDPKPLVDAAKKLDEAVEKKEEAKKQLDEHHAQPAKEYDEIRSAYLRVALGNNFLKYIYDSGFVDVGVGVASIVDALPDNGSDDDLLSVVTVLKVYPLGRWWAAVPLPPENKELVTITDDLLASIPRRLSIVAGLSVGDLSGGDGQVDLKGPGYLVGIAYDIVPQFAIVAGLAAFEVERDRGTGKDRDLEVAAFVGVVLNSESFLSLVNTQVTKTQQTPGGSAPLSELLKGKDGGDGGKPDKGGGDAEKPGPPPGGGGQ